MEYKKIRTELKAKGDGDNMTIEGYASTFTKTPDSYGDIVAAGAFKKTILERFTTPIKNGKPSKIVVLWQHQHPFGMPTKLAEDSTGLHFEADITNTTFGREQIEYVKHGVVKEASFGYDTIKHEINHDDDEPHNRILKEVKLYEFGPVTFGANDEAFTEAKMLKLLEKRFGDLTIGEFKRVVGYQNLALGDRATEWDNTAAERRVRAWADAEDAPNAKYRTAFLWYDAENEGNFTAYKLQIADIVGGRLRALPRGVFAAANAVSRAPGTPRAVDLPSGDRPGVRRHIDRYYAKMREEFDDDTLIAPWNRSIDLSLVEEKAGRVISTANIKKIVDAVASIENGTVTLRTLLAAAKPIDATPPDEEEPDKVTLGANESSSEKIADLLKRAKNIPV